MTTGTSREIIRHLYTTNVTDAVLLADFTLYDSSVTQKLWSANQHFRDLSNLDISRFVTPTLSSGTYISIPAIAPLNSLDFELFLRTFNMNLDGFFMNTMSVFDTLSHQLFSLYETRGTPTKIYLTTAQRMLARDFFNYNVRQFLDTQLVQHWFTEFEPFRHCTTHESLIRFEDLQIRIDPVSGVVVLSQPMKLPDNPQSRPFTYALNRIAVTYCQSVLTNVQTFISGLFDSILLDIHAHNNILPII